MSCGNVFGSWFSGFFCSKTHAYSVDASKQPHTWLAATDICQLHSNASHNNVSAVSSFSGYTDYDHFLLAQSYVNKSRTVTKSKRSVHAQPVSFLSQPLIENCDIESEISYRPCTSRTSYVKSSLNVSPTPSKVPSRWVNYIGDANRLIDIASPHSNLRVAHILSSQGTPSPMLSKIGSALQAAADVVAPPCARVEDLRYHWSQVVGACQRCQGPNSFGDHRDASSVSSRPDRQCTPTNNFQDITVPSAVSQHCNISGTLTPNGHNVGSASSDARSGWRCSDGGSVLRASMVPAVEETHIPRHLGHMLRVLLGEGTQAWGALTPCLEFLVMEKVFASLASFAWRDRPLGIRQHAYTFLTGVLGCLHYSHLHHTRIHKPLQCMVRASTLLTASPYEVQELDYLAALCEKILQDHSLVLVYIQPAAMTASYTPDPCLTPVPVNSRTASFSHSLPHTSHSADCSSCSPAQAAVVSPACCQQLPNEGTTPTNKDDIHISVDQTSASKCDQSSNFLFDGNHIKVSSRSSSPHSLSSEYSSSSSTRCSSVSTPLPLSSSHYYSSSVTPRHQPLANVQSSFPLVDALLKLCGSADCTVSSAAHDCLVQLCSVREPVCGRAIARHTLFPHYVASRVASCIAACPKDMDSMLVEELTLPKQKNKRYTERAMAAASSVDASSSDSDDNECHTLDDSEEEFQGRRELLQMLHWLAYCDKVVCTGASVLSSSLCHCLREMVLDAELRPGLSSPTPEVVSCSLALLYRLITALSSHTLVMSIVTWMCTSTAVQSSVSDEADSYFEESVLPLLLELCRNPIHQIQTLRLLQVAVESSRGGAAALLTGPWLAQRRYFDSSAAEDQQDCWSDEEDERARQQCVATSPGSQPISRTLAPSNINIMVKRFLSLVPEELRSSGADDFESYKSDAARQYRDVARCSAVHRWGREAVAHPLDLGRTPDSTSASSRESPPEAERQPAFTAGPFLELLLDLLESLPEQNYDVNLQVTSLVSCLSLLPLPHLHEYLMNPCVPMVRGARTPYSVLEAVVACVAPRITAAPDHRDHLQLARHQLLGAVDVWRTERDGEDRLYEAVIVIEEFSKELAAIAHAKYTVEMEASTTCPGQ